MPSYGERHSQYINIRFATCSDNERVTAYALYQFEDYTTLKQTMRYIKISYF